MNSEMINLESNKGKICSEHLDDFKSNSYYN